MKLTDLNVGEEGKVVSFCNFNKTFKRRIIDMGITKGVVVRVKKVAPLGDPLVIELRGYELFLRKKDLDSIEVVKV